MIPGPDAGLQGEPGTMVTRDASSLRGSAVNAIAGWEPRRIGYNLVLASIVAGCLAAPRAAKPKLSFDTAVSFTPGGSGQCGLLPGRGR
jgi:hypothetical protein